MGYIFFSELVCFLCFYITDLWIFNVKYSMTNEGVFTSSTRWMKVTNVECQERVWALTVGQKFIPHKGTAAFPSLLYRMFVRCIVVTHDCSGGFIDDRLGSARRMSYDVSSMTLFNIYPSIKSSCWSSRIVSLFKRNHKIVHVDSYWLSLESSPPCEDYLELRSWDSIGNLDTLSVYLVVISSLLCPWEPVSLHHDCIEVQF